MTELEQRLTNELSKLAAQYAQDQKQLAGQVERLEEQVRELAEQYEQVGKRYAEGVNFMTLASAEDQQKMGAHITKLTDAYEKQTNTCNEFTSAFNALVVDLNELFR